MNDRGIDSSVFANKLEITSKSFQKLCVLARIRFLSVTLTEGIQRKKNDTSTGPLNINKSTIPEFTEQYYA